MPRSRSPAASLVVLALAGCGLGEVGPDLDAWKAAQAAVATDNDLVAGLDAEPSADTEPDAVPDVPVDAIADAAFAPGEDTAPGDTFVPLCPPATPCNDNNPCTLDECDEQLGCEYFPTVTPCDDGLECTTADQCQGGKCQGKEAGGVTTYGLAVKWDGFGGVAVKPTGGIVAVGVVLGIASLHARVVATGSDGSVALNWTSTATGTDQLADVEWAPWGQFLAVGSAAQNGKTRAWLQRLDASGSPVGGAPETWFDGSEFTAVAVFADGAMAVGKTSGDGKTPDVAIRLRLDAQGKQASFGYANASEALSFEDVTATSESAVMVGTRKINQKSVGWLTRYQPLDTLAQEVTLTALGGEGELLGVVRHPTTGAVTAAGKAKDVGGWLVHFDAGGKVLWQRKFGDPDETLEDVVAAPDGGFIVVGSRESQAGSVMRRLDTFGGQKWQVLGGPGALTEAWIEAPFVVRAVGFLSSGPATDAEFDSIVASYDAWGYPTCAAAGGCKYKGGTDCSDGNGCTNDFCDAPMGCTVTDALIPCTDDDVCTTVDACKGGVCAGSLPQNCDDGNDCTADACDAKAGCTNAPIGDGKDKSVACDDGDSCSLASLCNAGTCVASSLAADQKVCDDGNPCTFDVCAAGKGCTGVPVGPLAPCAVAGKTGVCTDSQCLTGWAVRVATEADRSCALRADGGVWCWEKGLPSEGTMFAEAKATSVKGAIELRAGDLHTCATDAKSNAVLCWGSNSAGQSGPFGKAAQFGLGEANPAYKSVAKSLALGGQHTCVLHGAITHCWGDNGFAQGGLGTVGGTSNGEKGVLKQSNIPPPGNPGGLIYVLQEVAAGGNRTCSIDLDGAVWCWGDVATGTGIAPEEKSGFVTVATTLVLPKPAVALAVGEQAACALLDGSQVYCWGDNQGGIVHPNPGKTTEPMAVAGLPADVTELAVGHLHACARTSSGSVWCWGSNYAGQCGPANVLKVLAKPQAIPDVTDAVALSARNNVNCAVRKNGTVQCWGRYATAIQQFPTPQSLSASVP